MCVFIAAKYWTPVGADQVNINTVSLRIRNILRFVSIKVINAVRHRDKNGGEKGSGRVFRVLHVSSVRKPPNQ